jgi:hypothetical protein
MNYKNILVAIVLIACPFISGCDKTEGLAFFGPGVSEKFEGTYNGITNEMVSFLSTPNQVSQEFREPAVVVIDSDSNIDLDLSVKLCGFMGSEVITLALGATVDTGSDDTSEFEVTPESFPSSIFSDRSVEVISGSGRLNTAANTLEVTLVIEVRSTSTMPGASDNDTRNTVVIETDARGTGTAGC